MGTVTDCMEGSQQQEQQKRTKHKNICSWWEMIAAPQKATFTTMSMPRLGHGSKCHDGRVEDGMKKGYHSQKYVSRPDHKGMTAVCLYRTYPNCHVDTTQ